ncbi:hypothetical protein [Kitasatospora sp. NPDC017646]|uniref:hypothetical protein n=1 Tax=Kitasatospora sp. NPDC017646 TaxID=3364024 RepID=UPI00379D4922
MRKRFKVLAMCAVAVASVGLSTAPAFADSYSQYQSMVVSISHQGCFGTIDGMHDDTQGYWVARAAFYTSSSHGCTGALYRKKDGSSTWTEVSYQNFVPDGTWTRTGYHWDGPGAESKVCVSQYVGDPIGNGACSAPW